MKLNRERRPGAPRGVEAILPKPSPLLAVARHRRSPGAARCPVAVPLLRGRVGVARREDAHAGAARHRVTLTGVDRVAPGSLHRLLRLRTAHAAVLDDAVERGLTVERGCPGRCCEQPKTQGEHGGDQNDPCTIHGVPPSIVPT